MRHPGRIMSHCAPLHAIYKRASSILDGCNPWVLACAGMTVAIGTSSENQPSVQDPASRWNASPERPIRWTASASAPRER